MSNNVKCEWCSNAIQLRLHNESKKQNSLFHTIFWLFSFSDSISIDRKSMNEIIYQINSFKDKIID